MSRHPSARPLLLAATLLALPATGAAQAVVGEASFTALSVGDGSLTEIVVPVAVTWRLGAVRLDANTAFAAATYDQDGAESSLSGITDVTVRVMIPMLRDRARLIVAGNIPTGTESLAPDQMPVAAVLTTDLLGLPVRSFGSGAGVTTGLAVARPTGEWVLGGIAVYRVGSAYEPALGTGTARAAEFRPGSEVRLRLAAERPATAGITWRTAASWSHFGSDQADDEDVFIRGDRLLGEVSAEVPVGRGAASVFAWNLFRATSEIVVNDAPERTPSSNLAGLGGEVAWPLSAALTLRPRVELLVQSGDEGFGGGSGWITRVGSGASYRLGSLRLEPAILAQIGALGDEDITGFTIRGGVLWER